MGVKNMTGTPWHVETLGTGEGKQRHRSHCSHYIYNTKQCSYGGRCIGSAHCSLYEKMTPEEERKKRAEARNNPAKVPKTPKKFIKKDTPTNTQPQVQIISSGNSTDSCPVPVGAIAKSKKYKQGKVIKVNGMILTISFDSGIKKFRYPDCLSAITFIFSEKKPSI